MQWFPSTHSEQVSQAYGGSLKRRLAWRLTRPSLYAYLTLALALLGGVLGQRLSEASGLAQLAALASERLELYAATLESELARHNYLPSLIAIDEQVQAMLGAPQDLTLRAEVARKLSRINVRAGAMLTFITDARGQMLASSHLSTPRSAPEAAQVQRALDSGAEHFFAADAVDGSTRFFLIQPVRRASQVLGAIVVQLSLAPLEATWVDLGLRSQSEKLLVIDANDVVIMSSVPEWKYRILGSSDQAQAEALRRLGRYPGASLQPMNIPHDSLQQSDAALVPVPALPGQATQLLAQERPVAQLGVRLVTLSDPSEVWRGARYAAWGGAAVGASIGLLALYLASRRRALRQVFQAQAALQKAHAQLEHLVDERTAELRSTNQELKHQIAQRLQAEDELVQAGKLAVLGQMSAGISHEINQPLTALRALSRNTLLLLEKQRLQSVADNLKAIDDVTERMSVITRALKNFARKAEAAGQVQAAPLRESLQNVRVLLEHRLRAEQVELIEEIDERGGELLVNADANRLEQVLVNLFTNAMDAMQDQLQRRITVAAERRDGRVQVRVIDSGPGMDERQQARLFEPFFTTKPAGQGLGLGLVISSKIVHEFGGTLRAHRSLDGGMCFEFDLEPAAKDPHV
ncbi:ATP-binding protein [Paucibacter sp. APW11]|uniref:histidine kinase n=1 Tax=Roseateles aquae TaxID=3077235 RepID=A0ABU3P556_9BURK|nr:ATP-binding protein [Paucibacter sp. APW11]MDT8997699.1 ATP-binding protein [Paucibacter sp. APW11]